MVKYEALEKIAKEWNGGKNIHLITSGWSDYSKAVAKGISNQTYDKRVEFAKVLYDERSKFKGDVKYIEFLVSLCLVQDPTLKKVLSSFDR